MHIVFSGFRDDTLKKQIEENGGHVHASFVKDATHMIVKNKEKPSKKLDEAKEKGISIITLVEFVKEHDFSLAERKPRAKKETHEVPEESNKKPGKPENDFDLIYTVFHALKTKQNINEALNALDSLKARISA